MILSFRQGIVDYDITTPPFVLNGSSVNLVIGSRPLVFTIADLTTNYLYSEGLSVTSAWTLPDTLNNYWLYWDFNINTFALTRGVTNLVPIVQSTAPLAPASGQFWYNTTTAEQFVYTAGAWIKVIRVFACLFSHPGAFVSLGLNSPLFSGTQVGDTSSNVAAGRVLFLGNGNPIVKSDQTFFTTEDEVFSQSTSINAVRLESNVWTAQSQATAFGAYSIIAVNPDGTIRLATYEDTGNTVIGMALDSFPGAGSIGSVLLQGVVTNPAWNWSGYIGQALYVSYTSILGYTGAAGTLQVIDPAIESPTENPISHAPVARVLTADTLIFDQGLGQKGDTGTGVSGVSSVGIIGGTGLSVSGSPITSSGTIALTLNTELQGLSTLSTQGFITRRGTGTYSTSSFTSDATITITNPNGVNGSPNFVVNQSALNLSNIGGVLTIPQGGTGQVTAPLALNALLPSQTGNSGGYLTTNGTNPSWVIPPSYIPASGGTFTGPTYYNGSISSSTQLVNKQYVDNIMTLPDLNIPYDLAFFLAGNMLQASTISGGYIASRAVTIPAGAAGSVAKCGTAPQSNVVYSIQQNGSTVGTVTFAANATSGTISITSIVALAIGDIFTVVTPSTVESNIANVYITLIGTAVA